MTSGVAWTLKPRYPLAVFRSVLARAEGLIFGEGVLFARLGVEENREVAAHRSEPLFHHLFGRGAHDDPVALPHRTPEQLVPDCAAYEINFHGADSTAGD